VASESDARKNAADAGPFKGGVKGGAASMLTQASSRIRQINPNAAKTSTASGVTGVKELAAMAVSYAKQETVAPLKGLGRYAAFGFASAFCFAAGLFMLALGALRGIQAWSGANDAEQHGTLSGHLSWLPYLLAILVCAALLGLIGYAAKRATRAVSR
jgi:hypothetical protein